MSVILDHEAVEVVTRKKTKIMSVKCDRCGKEILPKPYRDRDDSSKYYKVTTGHHDWGNDSCDSIEHRDICHQCIGNFTTEYFQDGRDTAYIEIETAYSHEHMWEWD